MRPDAGAGMWAFCSLAEMIAGMRPEMCAPVARIPDETMKQLNVKYLFLDN